MEVRRNQIPELVKAQINSIDIDAQVVLFGSRARGDFNQDSDWDFLILLNQEIDVDTEDLIRNKLYDIELKTEEVITSIIEEKEEWEKFEETLIYKNIMKEGLTIN